MYGELLFLHGIVRWLVLILLVSSVYAAWRGLQRRRSFTNAMNALRHWTATTAHVQLMIGIVLYVKSPFVKMYFAMPAKGEKNSDGFFFGILHIAMMLSAIAVLTIGSAMAKRKTTDRDKYSTMLLWFSIALFLIFLAIPWPFSPLSKRPLFRTY
jgi:cytochrome b561